MARQVKNKKITGVSSVSRGTMPTATRNGLGAVRYGWDPPRKSTATGSIRKKR